MNEIEARVKDTKQQIQVFKEKGLSEDNEQLKRQLMLFRRVKKHEDNMQMSYEEME
jgi:hypothetical protein